jgi:hypothetical protein
MKLSLIAGRANHRQIVSKSRTDQEAADPLTADVPAAGLQLSQ